MADETLPKSNAVANRANHGERGDISRISSFRPTEDYNQTMSATTFGHMLHFQKYPCSRVVLEEPIVKVHDRSSGDRGVQELNVLFRPLHADNAENEILRSVLGVQSGGITVQPAKEAIVQKLPQQSRLRTVSPMHSSSYERCKNSECVIQTDFREFWIVMEYGPKIRAVVKGRNMSRSHRVGWMERERERELEGGHVPDHSAVIGETDIFAVIIVQIYDGR